MAEEKNQKPVSTPEQPDLEAHSDDNKIENNENTEKITRYKKQAARSFVLAFTTLIAIIAICIAWFVSNTKVTMTGTSISAENSLSFELASVGDRQEAEKNNLLNSEDKTILTDGTKSDYDSYFDLETNEEKKIKQTYYVGSSNLAWHLDGQERLSPGSSGTLELYLIPKTSGLSTATVNLSLKAYVSADGNNKAVLSTDNRLQNLINGHILLFQKLDDDIGYQNWINESGSIQIEAPGATGNETGTFQEGLPYKITLYWVWPKYFRNYVYTQRSTYGDLFNSISNNGYQELNVFLNEQRTLSNSKVFYDASGTTIANEINSSMSDETLNVCNKYYNQADEYIGNNAKYVYINAAVQ